MLTRWLNSPRRLIAAFVLLLVLPAGTVAWLGVQLLNQDRQLAARQARERREVTADRAVAELERSLSAFERRLSTAGPFDLAVASGDAVSISIDAGQLAVHPTNVLLYYPLLPASTEPTAAFSKGETLELRSEHPEAAIDQYRRLASGRYPPDVRAGALVRLARTRKNAGRAAEALDAYDQLEGIRSARVAGVPADLAARRARAVLFEQLHRHTELQSAARTLREGLLTGTWAVDRGTFEAYLRQADAWLGETTAVPAARAAVSAAVESLVANYRRGMLAANGRSAIRVHDTDVTVLWQANADTLRALVAGPVFVAREWREPARARLDGDAASDVLTFDHQPSSTTAGDPTAIRRFAAETGLPWTVVVTDTRAGIDSNGLVSQRRTIVAGVTLLLLTVTTGGYLTARAIGRELAVARLQSDFVAAVSHEFRTPLTTIRQFTALLLENDAVGPEKRRAFYQAQARATERLTRLIESLLDFGRMEAGAHPYRLEPISVKQLVSEAVEDFRRDPAAADFSIRCDIAAEAATVAGDWDALSRAIRNLLENAVNYSGESRCIDVTLTSQADAIGVTVQDQGFGIAPGEQRDIFKKFVRGSSSRQRGIKGTGVGLAIVSHIVAAHGGRIALESEVGRGSAFTLWLPTC
jgi:two-component system, OmpR family, phosphate regulon sensor histidine kinase PhoR